MYILASVWSVCSSSGLTKRRRCEKATFTAYTTTHEPCCRALTLSMATTKHFLVDRLDTFISICYNGVHRQRKLPGECVARTIKCRGLRSFARAGGRANLWVGAFAAALQIREAARAPPWLGYATFFFPSGSDCALVPNLQTFWQTAGASSFRLNCFQYIMTCW